MKPCTGSGDRASSWRRAMRQARRDASSIVDDAVAVRMQWVLTIATVVYACILGGKRGQTSVRGAC